LILEFLTQYQPASKENIDGLILDILPAVLDKQQRQNKVRNLLYAMKNKDKTIDNKGTNRKPKWVLNLSKTNTLDKL
jgi:ATP-dependent DNA helicase RecG